ncbi:MAG: amidohydrolase family protein [Dysosmobacter sp.]
MYVQSHLSESTNEIAWCRSCTPSAASIGRHTTSTVYGRTIPSWHTASTPDERERAAIRDAGVVVVHCGDSNVNICSGICPVRRMVNEGLWVTLGSDIAGGAQLPMYKVITMSIRTSKARRVTDEQHPEFLTVAEGYYLGTTSGHKYFGAGEGFAVGDKLHAVVIDDGDFPEAAHPLNVEERFERAIYMTHRHNIVSVWSDGREVVRR